MFVSHWQLHMISGETAIILQHKSNLRKQPSIFLAVLNANYWWERRKKVSLVRPASFFWEYQQILCRLHVETCTVNLFYFEFLWKDSFKPKFSNGNYSSLNMRRYQFLIKCVKSRKRAIFVRLLAIIFTLCMLLETTEHFLFRQVWKGCKVDCFCFFISSILSYHI